MVNIWLMEAGSDITRRSFGMEKYVKEILDDFVTDPEKRSNTYLVFLGKVLAEDMRLCDVAGVKDKHTLHVMIRSEFVSMPKLELSNKKLQECREKLQYLKTSRRVREKIIDEINKEDFMESLLNEFPLLKKDRTAQILAKDFILSCAYILGKQYKEEAFLHEHPILVDVIHYYLRNVNLPARMSHSGSSASISDYPTPASVHGSNAPIITPQMLQEAMAQAMRSVGVGAGNASQAASSSASSSRNSQHFSSASATTQYALQMDQLTEFGFTDAEQNARILEETGGNVEQALELLIALRESVLDTGEMQHE